MAKLKVYRTAIGFHDAYVAAPSQKAALKAWGSAHDLFARGVAEQVDDPALAAAPLAQPGAVIKRLRGSAAEQVAALPPDPAPAKAVLKAAGKRPTPPPDRAALDAAEAAIADMRARHAAEAAEIAAAEVALAARRRTLGDAHRREARKLEAARARAAARYARAREARRG